MTTHTASLALDSCCLDMVWATDRILHLALREGEVLPSALPPDALLLAALILAREGLALDDPLQEALSWHLLEVQQRLQDAVPWVDRRRGDGDNVFRLTRPPQSMK